jgi:hypothetical protein
MGARPRDGGPSLSDHEARLAERRQAEAARQGDVLVYVVGRPLMFIAWMLVFWGTVVALAAVYVFATRGPSAARTVLVPRTPLDVANAALAVIAVMVWIAVLVVSRGATRRDSGPRQ